MSPNNFEHSATVSGQPKGMETVVPSHDAPQPISSRSIATADNNSEQRDMAPEQTQESVGKSPNNVHAAPPSATQLPSLVLPAAGQDLVQYLDGLTQAKDPIDSSVQLRFTNNWKGAFDYKRRVVEQPDQAPANDPTITQVLVDREYWVAEFYTAMVNLDGVKDREGSYERKRMEPGKYDERQVEAVCREIFVSIKWCLDVTFVN